MSLIVILLCLIIVFLIIYIGFILNQLNSINKQLRKRLSENTRQPLNVVLFNKTIIKLTSNINHCLKLEEKRRLDSINEQKQFKELISNISHDLRTPLTSVKGYQQLLQKSDLDKEQLHNLQIAQKSTDDLGNLIEHFFEYSYLITSNIKPNLEKINIKIDIFKADVSKREEGHKLVEYALNKYGKIDILINNAGISEYKMFTDETDDDWNRVINNNLYSAFMMSQEVIPSMVHEKSGCIINISSIWAMVGASLEVIYSVSKAGMDGLTKALAKELGPSNIRVNSIAPGTINTDMNKNFSKEELEQIEENTPLGRIGSPKDIAKCVCWLIDDNFTTGQIISINGGWVI